MWIITKISTPRHIIVKLLKVKVKKKILTVREKSLNVYKETQIRLIA